MSRKELRLLAFKLACLTPSMVVTRLQEVTDQLLEVSQWDRRLRRDIGGTSLSSVSAQQDHSRRMALGIQTSWRLRQGPLALLAENKCLFFRSASHAVLHGSQSRPTPQTG